ncbi:hypothetical protein KOW79_010612 [Hemibagrus wyckioides]|uniref:Uncharacterized protein n=1 Tax=Hemibagrus wyckioides TaxID=337641 RepID=A0A9D3SIT3_9TELE|nr:hypothetical protein KOW79_010612 [Hemibagrus wyckioides]
MDATSMTWHCTQVDLHSPGDRVWSLSTPPIECRRGERPNSSGQLHKIDFNIFGCHAVIGLQLALGKARRTSRHSFVSTAFKGSARRGERPNSSGQLHKIDFNIFGCHAVIGLQLALGKARRTSRHSFVSTAFKGSARRGERPNSSGQLHKIDFNIFGCHAVIGLQLALGKARRTSRHSFVSTAFKGSARRGERPNSSGQLHKIDFNIFGCHAVIGLQLALGKARRTSRHSFVSTAFKGSARRGERPNSSGQLHKIDFNIFGCHAVIGLQLALGKARRTSRHSFVSTAFKGSARRGERPNSSGQLHKIDFNIFGCHAVIGLQLALGKARRTSRHSFVSTAFKGSARRGERPNSSGQLHKIDFNIFGCHAVIGLQLALGKARRTSRHSFVSTAFKGSARRGERPNSSGQLHKIDFNIFGCHAVIGLQLALGKARRTSRHSFVSTAFKGSARRGERPNSSGQLHKIDFNIFGCHAVIGLQLALGKARRTSRHSFVSTAFKGSARRGERPNSSGQLHKIDFNIFGCHAVIGLQLALGKARRTSRHSFVSTAFKGSARRGERPNSSGQLHKIDFNIFGCHAVIGLQLALGKARRTSRHSFVSTAFKGSARRGERPNSSGQLHKIDFNIFGCHAVIGLQLALGKARRTSRHSFVSTAFKGSARRGERPNSSGQLHKIDFNIFGCHAVIGLQLALGKARRTSRHSFVSTAFKGSARRGERPNSSGQLHKIDFNIFGCHAVIGLQLALGKARRTSRHSFVSTAFKGSARRGERPNSSGQLHKIDFNIFGCHAVIGLQLALGKARRTSRHSFVSTAFKGSARRGERPNSSGQLHKIDFNIFGCHAVIGLQLALGKARRTSRHSFVSTAFKGSARRGERPNSSGQLHKIDFNIFGCHAVIGLQLALGKARRTSRHSFVSTAFKGSARRGERPNSSGQLHKIDFNIFGCHAVIGLQLALGKARRTSRHSFVSTAFKGSARRGERPNSSGQLHKIDFNIFGCHAVIGLQLALGKARRTSRHSFVSTAFKGSARRGERPNSSGQLHKIDFNIFGCHAVIGLQLALGKARRTSRHSFVSTAFKGSARRGERPNSSGQLHKIDFNIFGCHAVIGLQLALGKARRTSRHSFVSTAFKGSARRGERPNSSGQLHKIDFNIFGCHAVIGLQLALGKARRTSRHSFVSTAFKGSARRGERPNSSGQLHKIDFNIFGCHAVIGLQLALGKARRTSRHSFVSTAFKGSARRGERPNSSGQLHKIDFNIFGCHAVIGLQLALGKARRTSRHSFVSTAFKGSARRGERPNSSGQLHKIDFNIFGCHAVIGLQLALGKARRTSRHSFVSTAFKGSARPDSGKAKGSCLKKHRACPKPQSANKRPSVCLVLTTFEGAFLLTIVDSTRSFESGLTVGMPRGSLPHRVLVSLSSATVSMPVSLLASSCSVLQMRIIQLIPWLAAVLGGIGTL